MQTIPVLQLLKGKFIGVDDLRRELAEVLARLPKEGEVIITQHGKPKGVLLALDYYLALEELQEQIADSNPKLVMRLNKALAEAKKGKKIPAEEVFKNLGI